MQRLPIDIDQITMGDDPSTNYQLLPGDRLVVPARTGSVPEDSDAVPAPPAAPPRERSGEPRRNQRQSAGRTESPEPVAPRRDLGTDPGRLSGRSSAGWARSSGSSTGSSTALGQRKR